MELPFEGIYFWWCATYVKNNKVYCWICRQRTWRKNKNIYKEDYKKEIGF